MGAFYGVVVAAGKLLRAKENKDLEWTIYRISALKNLKGELKAEYISEERWGFDTYRPDIVSWLIEQVEKDSPEWMRQKLSLWSKPMARMGWPRGRILA
jgi:hypothetical protein